MNMPPIPVLIGADLNCYNLARAFHEQYGVKSYVFGKYPISATKYSSILTFTAVADLEQEGVLVPLLRAFARQHPGQRLILLGGTDSYAMLLARCRDQLPEYIIPYPDLHLQPLMSKKADFYALCHKYGIPYPKTYVASAPEAPEVLTEQKLGFAYPIILKPSYGVDYWEHPFVGMQKVYEAESPARAAAILAEIYGAGYSDRMILQEKIPGGDSQMRVFTTFSDRNAKVRAMCLGHTMIEEHTPKGLGNHAAIVTEPVSGFPLTGALQAMLEDLGYTGFANFDIKLRPGTKDDFRVFEINLRQGRSNYYMTAGGINLARLASEVWDDGKQTLETCERACFWHHVPKAIAYRYTEDSTLVKKAKALAWRNRAVSSLWYWPDLRRNPLRLLCVAEHMRRHWGKFQRYYPKENRPSRKGRGREPWFSDCIY